MNDSEIDQDLDLFHSDEYEILTTKLCNKDKLAQICDILGINCTLLEMPKNGFTEQAIDTKAQALSRATRIVRKFTAQICDLISSSNAKFRAMMEGKESLNNSDLEALISNSTKLIFIENRALHITAQSNVRDVRIFRSSFENI